MHGGANFEVEWPVCARACGPLVQAPLLLAQGLTDTLVMPTAQQSYVEELCAGGQPVDFRTFAGRDHMGLVTGDSPLLRQLMEWTQDRFDGAPPTDTC